MPSAAAGFGVVSLIQGRKASKAASAATAKSEEQQRELSAEERRRKQYAHTREMAQMRAELAGSGLAETAGPANLMQKTKKNAGAAAPAGGGLIRSRKMGMFMRNVLPGRGGRPGLFGISGAIAGIAKQVPQYEYTPVEGGGTFSQYFAEKERVHQEEMAWMKRTGLSGIESTRLQGKAAQYTARADAIRGAGQIATGVYDWWKSRPPSTSGFADYNIGT